MVVTSMTLHFTAEVDGKMLALICEPKVTQAFMIANGLPAKSTADEMEDFFLRYSHLSLTVDDTSVISILNSAVSLDESEVEEPVI